jgi:hypothetical protein
VVDLHFWCPLESSRRYFISSLPSSYLAHEVKDLRKVGKIVTGLTVRVGDLETMTGPKSTMGMLKEIGSGTAAEVGRLPPPVLAVAKLTM